MDRPGSKPTADSTSAAQSWMRSRRDLLLLLDETLNDPEITDELKQAGIPVPEARAILLEDPTMLAQLRDIRDWRRALRTGDIAAGRWGLRSRRLTRARPFVRITVAVLVLSSYLALLFASSAAMPVWAELLGLVGLLATAGFAVGLASDDTWSVYVATRSSNDDTVWGKYARQFVIEPRLMLLIVERRQPDYSTTLSLRGVRHLYEEDPDAPVIITDAGRRLRRIMERSITNAVAIAGDRGVGKTTAIRAAARGMFSDPGAPPPMHVIAAAPSRYEARDFVLHLHAMLAKQVIALTGMLIRQAHQRAGLRDRVLGVLRVIALAMLPLTVALSLAFMVEGKPYQEFLAGLGQFFADLPKHLRDVVLHIHPGRPIDLELERSAVLIVLGVVPAIGIVIVNLVILLARAAARLARRSSRPAVARLRTTARHQLDRIRFLQTYTSGWSGKLGIKLGGDLGWSRGSQRAEQQLTHPEVVEMFREFAGQAAEVLTRKGAIERIVIAIDELDKIAEPAKAHEFVNDIKGIFGVTGCTFLVAVSDDALTAFERRGIQVRDAFDSAFPEMVRVDPFTLAESRRWIGRRLLAVPEPFSCLCHCLSGGLPRDLRRSTVDMIDAVRESGAQDLESVATLMVGRELARKTHAFAASARRLDDSPEVTAHLGDLLLVTQAGAPGELVELAARLAPGEDSAMPRTRWQSACFVLFCATVRQVFTNDLSESELDHSVELLGAARTQLAVDPRVAWRVICEVRAGYEVPDPAADPMLRSE